MARLSVAPVASSSAPSLVVANSALSTSGMRGFRRSQINGEGREQLCRGVNAVRSTFPVRSQTCMMANKNAGKGIFAPAVVIARNVLGKKKFNSLRGKGIALHSQVITEFCKSIGAEAKQRQGLIRLAKKNGEKLGFLA